MTRRSWTLLAVAVGTVILGVGAWLFEPWRLFTSSTVNEAAPTATTSPPAASGTPTAPASDLVLSESSFVDGEHSTSGIVRLLELADGRRFIRIEGLASSDGPDLHLWLSDQPSGGEWGSYDDGRHVALGDLKATHGNQNYEIPAEVELDGLQSVVIWCDRFNVAFGTAQIDPRMSTA